MAGGRDRVACATRATRSTCWPSTSWRWWRWSRGRVDDLAAVVRRAAPVRRAARLRAARRARHAGRALPVARSSASCGPRITWDRVTDQLRGRPGAQRLAVTSGGTIPDRGLFTVMTPGGADGAGSRVGELDEEMVYESRVGDTFLLGTSSWRVEDITHDRVIVTPAPGRAGPDAVLEGRVDRAGRWSWAARSARSCGRCPRLADDGGARPRRRPPGSTSGPSTTCSPTCASSARPPGTCPATARSSSSASATSWATGGWWCTPRSARRSTAPWALAIAARMRERRGVEVHASRRRRRHRAAAARRRRRHRRRGHAHAPRTCCSTRPRSSRSWWPSWAARRCTRRGSGSARPARCCCPGATRSGAPRCGSSGRSSAQLLAVAGRYEQFPVTLEAMRECVQDVYDLPGPARADGRRAPRGKVQVVEVATPVAVAVRAQPAVRLRRDVPLRGGRPAGRAPGRRAVARLHAAGRAAGLGGDPRAARPRGAGRGRGVAAAAGPGPARPRRRGRGRPAAVPRRPAPPPRRRPAGCGRSG